MINAGVGMRRIVRLVAASLVLAGGMAGPGHAATKVLQPSSLWQVTYGDGICRVSRTFGTGGKSTLLYLEKYGISQSFTLLVAGSPIAPFADSSTAMSFSNGAKTASIIAGRNKDFGAALISSWTSLYPDQAPSDGSPTELRGEGAMRPALLRGEIQPITSLAITRGNSILQLNTGPMDAPRAALEKCLDKLVADLGVDPAKVRAEQQPPRPTEDSMAKVVEAVEQHYPQAAIIGGSQANLSLRLVIDRKGDIDSCSLIHITLAKDFDNFPCEAFRQHAKFAPALDRDGNAIKSIYTINLNFRLQTR